MNQGEPRGFSLSLWEPGRDNVEALTQLLHRAYRELADRGLLFVATHQDASITARRISRGECWVARCEGEIDGALVGTILWERAGSTSGCLWYERPEVASFHQFGVEPAWRGRGVGSALLSKVEDRVRESGAAELALDTAEGAEHLIALYQSRGYRLVGEADWPETNYRSVILSKTL